MTEFGSPSYLIYKLFYACMFICGVLVNCRHDTVVTIPTASCPFGFKSVNGVSGSLGNCFWLETVNKKSQNEARIMCESMGSHLATLPDEETYQAVTTFASIPWASISGEYWIGLNDLVTENVYQWPDGSNLSIDWNRWDVSNGAYPQPNDVDGSQDCVVASSPSDPEWQDRPCAEQHYYLCQRNKELLYGLVNLTAMTLRVPEVMFTVLGEDVTLASANSSCLGLGGSSQLAVISNVREWKWVQLLYNAIVPQYQKVWVAGSIGENTKYSDYETTQTGLYQVYLQTDAQSNILHKYNASETNVFTQAWALCRHQVRAIPVLHEPSPQMAVTVDDRKNTCSVAKPAHPIRYNVSRTDSHIAHSIFVNVKGSDLMCDNLVYMPGTNEAACSSLTRCQHLDTSDQSDSCLYACNCPDDQCEFHVADFYDHDWRLCEVEVF